MLETFTQKKLLKREVLNGNNFTYGRMVDDMSIALDEIKRESEERLNQGSAEEMSDMIFDTLFQNTHFPQLDM